MWILCAPHTMAAVSEKTGSAGSIEGEMNYRAVENCYYLSGSGAAVSGENTEVTLTYGGESQTYTVSSVNGVSFSDR